VRETFTTAGELLNYYMYVKCSVSAMPTLMPKKDFGDKTQKMRAQIQQSSMEEKYAFIGDVENFARWFYHRQTSHFKVPEECLLKIFHQQKCKTISSFNSWGHLALHFKKRIEKGENLPKRLRHKQYINGIGHEMRDVVEEYFSGIGMIQTSQGGDL